MQAHFPKFQKKNGNLEQTNDCVNQPIILREYKKGAIHKVYNYILVIIAVCNLWKSLNIQLNANI